MTFWAEWTDAQMEANFSPRKAVPGIEQHLEDFATRAAETRRFYDMRRNIAYGDHPREIYDVFPGIIGGPMHIFIHGGYWRALSKDDHSFVAPPFNAAGATVVMMNYPLCPEVTLSSLVASVMKGVAHAISNAADYGASPDRVHVSGHSAGGHRKPWPPPTTGLATTACRRTPSRRLPRFPEFSIPEPPAGSLQSGNRPR